MEIITPLIVVALVLKIVGYITTDGDTENLKMGLVKFTDRVCCGS